MKNSPSPNGSIRRKANGRFASGNAGGPGNPYVKRAAELRTALYASVTPADLRKIVKRMVQSAKDGDLAASREVLNRLLGKPEPIDVLARLEALEEAASKQEKS